MAVCLLFLSTLVCCLAGFSATQIQPQGILQVLIDGQIGKVQKSTADAMWDKITSSRSNLTVTSHVGENHLQELCPALKVFQPQNYLENRAIWLLCRGPIYTYRESRKALRLLNQLEEIHGGYRGWFDGRYLKVEPDLARLISQSRDPHFLQQIWILARDGAGAGMQSRNLFAKLVPILNTAAQRNGYQDIGECWREEIEMENLEEQVEEFYHQILPCYKAIHAFVRYKLGFYYGHKEVASIGPIPAHLLGNLWGQNWGSIFDIVVNEKHERKMEPQKENNKIIDIFRDADDFFQSIGFDPLPDKFWKKSKWDNVENCHANSVNMFRENDVRVSMCADNTKDDVTRVYHETGHIHYYLQYQHINDIFKDGASSAMHECIGDAGVLAAFIYKNNAELDEMGYLLKLGLRLIPQAMYSLVMEKWRWRVFRGEIPPDDYNTAWWKLRLQYQGIKPPVDRSHLQFDPAVKYHVAHNIPYIRYFLSSFCQIQLFEAMCRASFSGQTQSLHTCNISGSKNSTFFLRKMMSLGRSIDFSTAMKFTTGSKLSAEPLIKFFRPLTEWLQDFLEKQNVTTGWNEINGLN